MLVDFFCLGREEAGWRFVMFQGTNNQHHEFKRSENYLCVYLKIMVLFPVAMKYKTLTLFPWPEEFISLPPFLGHQYLQQRGSSDVVSQFLEFTGTPSPLKLQAQRPGWPILQCLRKSLKGYPNHSLFRSSQHCGGRSVAMSSRSV